MGAWRKRSSSKRCFHFCLVLLWEYLWWPCTWEQYKHSLVLSMRTLQCALIMLYYQPDKAALISSLEFTDFRFPHKLSPLGNDESVFSTIIHDKQIKHRNENNRLWITPSARHVLCKLNCMWTRNMSTVFVFLKSIIHSYIHIDYTISHPVS